MRNPVLVAALSLAVFIFAFSARGDRVVFRNVAAEAMSNATRMVNGGLEDGGAPALPGWTGWSAGFDLDASGGRNGSRGVRCVSEDPAKEYGVSQTIVLNQTQPGSVLAVGWSKAENVDGAPDMGYSLYLDITFMDGTPLWAQTASFSTGTHDWERRTRIVTPAKPIRSVTILGLFRHHRGTVHFDDLALFEASENTPLFEGGLVKPGDAIPPDESKAANVLDTGDGLRATICPDDGMMNELMLDGNTIGKRRPLVFVRDVAASGDFVTAEVWRKNGETRFDGDCVQAGLRLSATCSARDGAIEIGVDVGDLRKTDRAVTLYAGIPLQQGDWTWWDDPHHSRPTAKGVFSKERYSGAGVTSTRSMYPFAVLTGAAGGLAIAVPLDDPRHVRLGYDADHGLLFAAFDVGLSESVRKSPGTASCHLRLFRTDSQWAFRGALARYYELYPESFVKRVRTEGLWMAFTDVGSVRGWQDFGFAYHEGNNSVAWDEANGLSSFVYVEPMTTWLAFPPEVPRTYDGAMAYLDKQCEEGKPEALKTRLSGVRGSTGQYTLSVENAPWCNGAVYALNADPDLPPTDPDKINQGQYALNLIESAITESQCPIVANWWCFGDRYALDDTQYSEGRQSIRLTATEEDHQVGAVQWLTLDQTEPKPLLVRASIRRAHVTGVEDADCSVYVDLAYTDGTPLFAQTLSVPPGSGDFTTMEHVIRPDKPLASARVHLMMRGKHTGTVWFDDIYVGDADGQTNRIANPGCEGKAHAPAGISGAYLDSYEFWATNIDYERAHFAGADIPLVFDPYTHQLGVLTIFSTFEFERELAKRMHTQGKLMMANGVLHSFDFPAAYLDVLGTETNWFPDGKWSPMTCEELFYKRALSYQKPYCFLMNTHYASLTLDDIERYIQRCMFYGMFPGFFSENAATSCFFANPDWYDPARPLFRKYMPIIRALAEAGWQPITHARSSNGKLLLERFGDAKRGALYFTALNDSQEPVDATVTVDAKALGYQPDKITLRDTLTNQPVEAQPSGDTLTYPVRLVPQTSHAIRAEIR